MVIFFDTKPLNGACCFRSNVMKLLRDKDYSIYTTVGRYLKVDTEKKTCFGKQTTDGADRIFKDSDSWVTIRESC